MARVIDNSPPGYDLPDANQLEISLFGPGYGECLVVHYGNGLWFTVDSCLEDDRQTPSALAYLNRLGVDPTKQVTHNVVTHPDGDHIGGISTLFSACSAASLVCSSVLTDRDMVSYNVYHSTSDPTPLTRATQEICDLLVLSTERPPYDPHYVKQDTLIIDKAGIRVTALAPSNRKTRKFLTHVSQQIPKKMNDRRAPGSLRPNEVSVVLLLEKGDFSAVFGADLEETPGEGWSTILDTSIAFRNAGAPNAYKVAHHGSNNADCPNLWGTMNNPTAILTPFKRGSSKIPTRSDVDRILEYTKAAFSTSSFKTQTVKRLSRADKILNQHGIRHRDLYPKNGHIRLRVSADSTVKVDLFESAVHLSEIH